MASANFPLSLLKCPICENIPLKYTMVFCDNGHLVCVSCKNLMENTDKCPTCNKPLVSRRNNFVEQILDTLELTHCKNKSLGCTKMLVANEKDDHENQCQFKIIDCFDRECQNLKNQYPFGSIKVIINVAYQKFKFNSYI